MLIDFRTKTALFLSDLDWIDIWNTALSLPIRILRVWPVEYIRKVCVLSHQFQITTHAPSIISPKLVFQTEKWICVW